MFLDKDGKEIELDLDIWKPSSKINSGIIKPHSNLICPILMIPTNTFKIALDKKMKLLPSARLLDKVVSKLGLSAFGKIVKLCFTKTNKRGFQ